MTRWGSRALAMAALAVMLSLAGMARATGPLAFEGVELGMTNAAWRALKPPGPIPAHARRACSDDPAAKKEGLEAPRARADEVVCGYTDVYGGTQLSVPFAWRGYRLDHLRFVFEGGRLTEIRGLISTDAFEALVADFEGAYGPATRIVRDTTPSEIGALPRVTKTWRTPQGLIEIVDPVAPYSRLSVRIASVGGASIASSAIGRGNTR